MGDTNLREGVRYLFKCHGRASHRSSNPNIIAIEEIVPRFDLNSRYTIPRSDGIACLPKSGDGDSSGALAS
jgi:hypothetical protein